jgi:ribosomal protein S27E
MASAGSHCTLGGHVARCEDCADIVIAYNSFRSRCRCGSAGLRLGATSGGGLFVLGAVPALLSIYVMRSVQESTSWAAARGTKRASAAAVLKAPTFTGCRSDMRLTAAVTTR